MQNTVYECKQNGEDFFSLPAVTCSRFGNCPANVLVTEQPQYSVVICIFFTWQNIETVLISNGLRFILTCPLLLAQPITFHTARRSFATNAYLAGLPPISIMKITGHKTESSFMKYIKISEKENAIQLKGHEFFNQIVTC